VDSLESIVAVAGYSFAINLSAGVSLRYRELSAVLSYYLESKAEN